MVNSSDEKTHHIKPKSFHLKTYIIIHGKTSHPPYYLKNLFPVLKQRWESNCSIPNRNLCGSPGIPSALLTKKLLGTDGKF